MTFLRPRIRISLFFVPLFALLAPTTDGRPTNGPPDRVILGLPGNPLTIEELVQVAQMRIPVEIHPSALERVEKSHKLLMRAGAEDYAIYGLTRGVGENKDKPIEIFRDGELTPEGRAASEQFNWNMLHSHGAGVGPELPEDVVRAVLLARLNTLLLGQAACERSIVVMYQQFLNRSIHPVLPSRGSVGQADITILPHIGLAMMGEWEVHFNGRRMAARDALREAGLPPVKPFGKDGLAILSSNAFSAGMGALLVHEIEQLLDSADAIFTLSLEGLNGNVAPLLSVVQDVRPYPFQQATAARMREHLNGSYLWTPEPEKHYPRLSPRALQDPLSFRTASQVHGTARAALEYLKQQIEIQLNSSDDNPAVILDAVPDEREAKIGWSIQSDELTGMVVPTANFEPTVWALGFEMLGVSLSHVSRSSTYRMIKLGTEHFTQLRRFLAPDDESIAFSTIEKTHTALDTEIRALSRPVSTDFIGVAGAIEDHASNAPLIVQRVARITDNLRYILGMELMYAAQAVDLRRRQLELDEVTADSVPELLLGEHSGKVYEAFRTVVPFMDRDRLLSIDIEKAYEFVKFDRVTGAFDSPAPPLVLVGEELGSVLD